MGLMRFWFPSDTNSQHFLDECETKEARVDFDRAIFVRVKADSDTLEALKEKAAELGGIVEEE